MDKYGIGIGYIQSALNDSGCHQNIIITIDKSKHHFFQLFAFHLTMPYPYFCIGNQSLDHPCYFLDILYPIVNEEDLSSTLQLIGNPIADHLLIEGDNLAFDRIAIGWWGSNHRKISCCHETKL